MLTGSLSRNRKKALSRFHRFRKERRDEAEFSILDALDVPDKYRSALSNITLLPVFIFLKGDVIFSVLSGTLKTEALMGELDRLLGVKK